jgi:MFS transporter, DHA3 family, tetracycline resistance protein
VQALRPVSYPMVTGRIVAHVDPGVRATVLSAREMFASAGQIVGGPFVGWIGVIGTIRTALYAGAAALLPAVGPLGVATARMRPHTRHRRRWLRRHRR